MNVLIIIVAGVSAGWATQKLYRIFFTTKKSKEGEEEATVVAKEKTSKKKVRKQVRKPKKKIKEKEPSQVKDNHVDDLSQLKGIGPKLSEALEEIGIQNYEQLFNQSVDLLLTRLRETGGRFTRPAITAIIERAKLAAKER